MEESAYSSIAGSRAGDVLNMRVSHGRQVRKRVYSSGDHASYSDCLRMRNIFPSSAELTHSHIMII